MKLKYPKEVVDFLRGASTIITTKEGNEYMFLPFWFKTTDDPEVLESTSLDGNLPDDLVKAINDKRNPLPKDVSMQGRPVFPEDKFHKINVGDKTFYMQKLPNDFYQPKSEFGPDGGIL